MSIKIWVYESITKKNQLNKKTIFFCLFFGFHRYSQVIKLELWDKYVTKMKIILYFQKSKIYFKSTQTQLIFFWHNKNKLFLFLLFLQGRVFLFMGAAERVPYILSPLSNVRWKADLWNN